MQWDSGPRIAAAKCPARGWGENFAFDLDAFSKVDQETDFKTSENNGVRSTFLAYLILELCPTPIFAQFWSLGGEYFREYGEILIWPQKGTKITKIKFYT